MFYPTLPEDTQDFGQVLSGVGRSLRDISRGVSYYPYDLLGSGVDVANLALGAVGLGSERPVLGSDYLRNIARSLGMAQEPTGSATENITRLAAGLTNPMAGARAVGRVGEITTEQANRAADALVRQITGNPEATAPAVLEAAGGMVPLSRMFKPEQVKAILPETKIVDEAGNPQLMYHGTTKEFKDFKKNATPDDHVPGISVTDEPWMASGYAKEVEGSNVRPVYVDAKNPINYEDLEAWAFYKAKEKRMKIEDEEDFAAFDIPKDKLVKWLKEDGYDAIDYRSDPMLGYGLRVFEPEQIKSAVSDPAFAGLLEPQAGAKTSSKKWTEEEIAVFNEQKLQKQLMQAKEQDRLSQENKQLAKKFIEKLPSMGVAKDFTKDQLDSISYYRLAGDRKGAMEEGASQTVNLLEKKLKDMGVQIVHKSNIDGGNSIYANVNGKIVRISDHYLPETSERLYKGNKWDNEVITYDWANTNLDDYLKRITSPVVE